MIGLTAQQGALLVFIKAYVASYGIAPTIREMAIGMGTKSNGRVKTLLTALEERGAIRRIPNRARAVEINASELPGRTVEAIADDVVRRAFAARQDGPLTRERLYRVVVEALA